MKWLKDTEFQTTYLLKYAQSKFYFVDFVQTYFHGAWGTVVFWMTLMDLYNKLKIFQKMNKTFKEEMTEYFKICTEVEEERKGEF